MPFGVIRFRKLHASWVSTVGTKGRSLFTQPMQRGGPRHRDERVEQEREQRPAPGGVLELALDRRPVDALEAGDRDARAASRMPASMPMFTRLSRLILSGGTSSAPVAVASSARSSLSALPEVLHALGQARGKRRRLHHGDHRADPLLRRARRPRPRWRARCRRAARCTPRARRRRGRPVLLAGGVGTLKSSNATERLVDDDAEHVEVAVRDAGMVQPVELAARRRRARVADLIGGQRTDRLARTAEW